MSVVYVACKSNRIFFFKFLSFLSFTCRLQKPVIVNRIYESDWKPIGACVNEYNEGECKWARVSNALHTLLCNKWIFVIFATFFTIFEMCASHWFPSRCTCSHKHKSWHLWSHSCPYIVYQICVDVRSLRPTETGATFTPWTKKQLQMTENK